jgi:hypothetical protein
MATFSIAIGMYNFEQLKVFIMPNYAFKTFDLVPKLEVLILALD